MYMTLIVVPQFGRSSNAVLFFDCLEEVLIARLKKRAETSGRADDNDETIQKRLNTYNELSKPVFDYFDKQGSAHKVRRHVVRDAGLSCIADRRQWLSRRHLRSGGGHLGQAVMWRAV